MRRRCLVITDWRDKGRLCLLVRTNGSLLLLWSRKLFPSKLFLTLYKHSPSPQTASDPLAATFDHLGAVLPPSLRHWSPPSFPPFGLSFSQPKLVAYWPWDRHRGYYGRRPVLWENELLPPYGSSLYWSFFQFFALLSTCTCLLLSTPLPLQSQNLSLSDLSQPVILAGWQGAAHSLPKHLTTPGTSGFQKDVLLIQFQDYLVLKSAYIKLWS